MSHYCYDFLADSELFSDDFLNGKSNDIEKYKLILENYVKHCIEKSKETLNEITVTSSAGIRTIENPFGGVVSSLTESNLMSQSLLQDLVIIPDPLFSYHFSLQDQKANSAHSELLGMEPQNYLTKLKDICRFMKMMTPFIVNKVLKFYPDFSKIKEQGLPIYYSPTGFSEYLEGNILNWLHENVHIYPMKKSDKGLLILKEEKLIPCRSIYIEFDGSDGDCSNFYNLFVQEVLSYDDKTNLAEMAFYLPDEPPEQSEFDHWVYQSINQSGRGFVNRAKKDIFYADKFNCQFKPQNDFVLNLISQTFSIDQKKVVNENYVDPSIRLNPKGQCIGVFRISKNIGK